MSIEQSLAAECEHDAWAATCADCHERHHAEIIALKAEVERLEHFWAMRLAVSKRRGMRQSDPDEAK